MVRGVEFFLVEDYDDVSIQMDAKYVKTIEGACGSHQLGPSCVALSE